MQNTLQPKPLRWYQLITVNAYWLGIGIASGTITPVLLPFLVLLFMPPELKNTYVATIRVVSLAVAMLVQPLAGMLSDRSTLRWGRRRPFIFIGAVVNVLLLVIVGASTAFTGDTGFAVLMLGIVLLQISSNVGHGALQGLIPDVVPENQRGRASGVKAVLELLPVFLVLFIGPLVSKGLIWQVIGIMMAAFLVTMLLNIFFVTEQPQVEKATTSMREPALRMVALTVLFVGVSQAAVALVRAAGTALHNTDASMGVQIGLGVFTGLLAMAGSIFIGVYYGAWIGIGKDAPQQKSFIWWVVNRLLFLAAVGSIQGFAQYYLLDVLKMPNAASSTTVLLASVAVFLIPASLVGGYLADRMGRKRLVGLAGLIAAFGTLILLLAGSFTVAIIAGAIIGLGTGLFMATNWAMGTDLAPKADAGRYLGISNLAGAGAGIVGAGIGGPMADFFNSFQPGLGYMVIFSIYGLLFLLSTLTLTRVEAK